MDIEDRLARMTREIAQHFRDQLRSARATILQDSEAFEATVVVFERLGRWISPAAHGLGQVKEPLNRIAKASALASQLPDKFPHLHLSYESLIELVRDGRNAAVHEGALARHVTTHCMELALMLEDSLMAQASTVAEFMVHSPITASPWFPISYVRQIMLANSFSYLPVKLPSSGSETWSMVSDVAVANYLGAARSRERDQRMRTTIEEAASDGELTWETPRCVKPDYPIAKLKGAISGTPILVVEEHSRELLGILTAFDLL